LPVEHVKLAFCFHGVTVDGVLDLDRRVVIEMPEATAEQGGRPGLPEQPVQAFGARCRIARQKGAEFLGQIEQDRAGFENATHWIHAMVSHCRDLRVGIDVDKARTELLAFTDLDQPGVVLSVRKPLRQQLLEHHRGLDAIGRGQRIQLVRMLPHRQYLVVGRAGDGAVDIGKLTPVLVPFPLPDFRWHIVIGAHGLTPGFFRGLHVLQVRPPACFVNGSRLLILGSMTRRTKIVATLGPATDEPEVLERVITAGCDVVRVNFSHGDHETHARRIKMVRAAARELDSDVAVLADLAGPKIRIDRFREGAVELQAGDPFALFARADPPAGDEHGVGVAYLGLVDDVSPGSELLLDDGLMALRVERIEGQTIHCTVLTSGPLSDRKGLNLRGGGLSVPGVSEADARDIERAAEWQVDYLAVSFPRGAEDMQRARDLLQAAGGHAGLVSKIERAEAIENLEEIIEASDAVLVARGDLGVEIGDAELPGLQKRIIKASLAANRPVITATQIMQSMVESPIPTRAEVLDVANAVIDGTDAVMLSAETAVGRHPVTVIEAMR